MHWVYLLLAIAFLVGAAKAAGWLVVLLLAASLVLFVAWMLGWVSNRISSGARNDAQIISPEELRRLRDQAQARKQVPPSSPGDPQA